MTWYAWAVVALIVAASVASITAVGKPRQPLTGGTAAVSVVLNGMFIWALVALAERCS